MDKEQVVFSKETTFHILDEFRVQEIKVQNLIATKVKWAQLTKEF